MFFVHDFYPSAVSLFDRFLKARLVSSSHTDRDAGQRAGGGGRVVVRRHPASLRPAGHSLLRPGLSRARLQARAGDRAQPLPRGQRGRDGRAGAAEQRGGAAEPGPATAGVRDGDAGLARLRGDGREVAGGAIQRATGAGGAAAAAGTVRRGGAAGAVFAGADEDDEQRAVDERLLLRRAGGSGGGVRRRDRSMRTDGSCGCW